MDTGLTTVEIGQLTTGKKEASLKEVKNFGPHLAKAFRITDLLGFMREFERIA